jgi:hypothetical protein
MMPSPDMPVSDECLLCNETILTGEPAGVVGTYDGFAVMRRAHTECLMRSVLGGIGHHEDHWHWCRVVGDPDGGRTYRQSAIEVAALYEAGKLDMSVGDES